ncbi:Cytoplasmic ATP-dependent RNA helicase, partial [Reticulomyxa filosa]
SVKLDNVKNFAINCKNEQDKLEIFKQLYRHVNVGQIIVFVNTIKAATGLFNDLDNDKLRIQCSVLFGAMAPDKRDLTMREFREGKTSVLIATNVIARGIDVPSVKLVINYEIPIDQREHSQTGQRGTTFDSETFMHRVGRTGRFGTNGACISLVHDKELSFTCHFFKKIEQIISTQFLSADRLQAIVKEYHVDMKSYNSSVWKTVTSEIEGWVGTGPMDTEKLDLNTEEIDPNTNTEKLGSDNATKNTEEITEID